MTPLAKSRASLLWFVALVCFYHLLQAWLQGAVAIGSHPTWWLPEATTSVRVLSWVHLESWLLLALFSTPIAVLTAIRFPLKCSFVAVGIATLALVLPSLLFAALTHEHYSPVMTASLLADNIKYLVTLPLLTIAALRVLSAMRRSAA